MNSTETTAYQGARIFDGERWHDGAALVVEDGKILAIGEVPEGATAVHLNGGILAPGYVDLQVNGGGGHLVGPTTTAENLADICAVHAKFGVTSLLPTLITDTPEVTDIVLSAGVTAARIGTPGFFGLHLEGPHLAVARKGAHDPALIRPMEESDLVRLERARRQLPHLLVTVAAETVHPEQIARLVNAGIVVSIGHSDANFEEASAAFRAGATMATHLFNAMSQIGNRDPGVVGAALQNGAVFAGLIADGIHVHSETLRIARAAKVGPGKLFLVSDSMSQAGTNITSFELNGRQIFRHNGALRLGDGTLAGADLTMDRAVHLMANLAVVDEALRMATRYPAKAMGSTGIGRLVPGAGADFVHLVDLAIAGTFVGGKPVFNAPSQPR